jgi:hypothetical protein
LTLSFQLSADNGQLKSALETTRRDLSLLTAQHQSIQKQWDADHASLIAQLEKVINSSILFAIATNVFQVYFLCV